MAPNYDKQNKKNNKLITEIENLKKTLQKKEEENKSFINLKHEIARLNTIIFTLSEKLNKQLETVDSINAIDTRKTFTSIKNDINTIYHASSMVSSRMIYADLELNPQALSQQSTFSSGVYKKFDKARYILLSLSNKSYKTIQFQGESYFSIQTILAFDCLPFILLDNAVKYAPENTNITVTFQESPDAKIGLRVIVESIGPFVTEENIKKLTLREYRDINAVNTDIHGQGLGLFIAKQICSLYDIALNIKSESILTPINGIDYGKFIVTLDFPTNDAYSSFF